MSRFEDFCRRSMTLCGGVGRSIAVTATIGLAVAIAAVDIDKLLSLAQERYGARGTQLINQWQKLGADVKDQSDTEILNTVNNFVNRRVVFTEDSVAWNQPDYWATPLESMGRGVGDCEDYAIAKYITLLNVGIPNEKIRMIYVKARLGGAGSAHNQAHMVLGYFSAPDAEPLILDNLISSVRPASSRQDLLPVFSFNSDGLWSGGGAASQGDPTARLSKWRDVIDRMRQEGWLSAQAGR